MNVRSLNIKQDGLATPLILASRLINFIALIRRIKYGGADFSIYLPCSLLFEGIFTRS